MGLERRRRYCKFRVEFGEIGYAEGQATSPQGQKGGFKAEKASLLADYIAKKQLQSMEHGSSERKLRGKQCA